MLFYCVVEVAILAVYVGGICCFYLVQVVIPVVYAGGICCFYLVQVVILVVYAVFILLCKWLCHCYMMRVYAVLSCESSCTSDICWAYVLFYNVVQVVIVVVYAGSVCCFYLVVQAVILLLYGVDMCCFIMLCKYCKVPCKRPLPCKRPPPTSGLKLCKG